MSDETSRSSGTLAPLMLSAGTFIGDDVFNHEGDDLGKIRGEESGARVFLRLCRKNGVMGPLGPAKAAMSAIAPSG